jgi:hypothetical protein
MRPVLLVVALLFTALIAAGTIQASVSRGGPGPLEIFGMIVVALFIFGIVGALRHPPEG